MPSDVLITPATSKIDFTDGANSTKKLSISGTAFSFNSNLNVLSSTSLSSAFKAEGVNGTLFEVTDDLSNSLMSVNTIGGLPVFEVFANNSIIGGQYGANDFVISGNKIGLGYANPVNKLSVSGSVSIGSSYNVAAPSNGLIVQGNVGIGTVSPSARLTIVDNTNGGIINLVGRTSDDTAAVNFRVTSDASTYAYISPDTNEFRLYHNDGFMSFYPGGTEKWRITAAGILESNGLQTIRTNTGNLTLATALGNGHILLSPHGTGNVGIGTVTPRGKLEISNASDSRLIVYETGTAPYTATLELSSQVLGTYGATVQYTSDTEKLTIQNYGRSFANSTGGGILFRTKLNNTTATDVMVINGFSGNVGIGTTVPTAKLDVLGVRLGRDFSIANRATVRLDSNGTTYPSDVLFGHTAAANQDGWTSVYWSLSSRAAANSNRFYFYRGGGNPAPNNSEAVIMSFDPNLNVGVGFEAPTNRLSIGGSVSIGSNYNTAATTNGLIVEGSVGIGITNPADKLHVIGNIRINGGDILNWSGQAFIQTIGANDMFFRPNSTLQMILTAGGNLGVGNGFINPLAKLHLNSTTSGATLLRADGTNGTLFSVVDDLSDSLMSVNNSAGLPVLEVFADDRVVAGQYGANDFVLINNKLGLGTNSPAYKLDVRGSTVNARVGLMEFGTWPLDTTYIYLQNNTLSLIGGNYGFLQGPAGETFVNAASGQTLHFRIGNSEKWAITSAGILQSDGLQTIRTSTGTLTLATNGTNGHIILSPHGTGNVGIGTATPGSKLEVGSTNDGILTLNKSSGTGWGYINFSQAGTRRFYFGLNASFEPELGVDNGTVFRVVGGMTVAGNTVLNAGNYGGYSTFTGAGTFIGNIAIITDASTGDYSLIAHKYAGVTKAFSGYNGGLAIYGGETGIPTRIQANGQYVLTALTNGNIGIGTVTPAAKLDVVGSTRLSSNLLSHKVASYTTSYPGISSFGADTTDSAITYYDTGKLVANTEFRGVVWTGKHYIFTSLTSNLAYFYDNNFNLITNSYGLNSVSLPLPSGYSYPHGAAWDGRYLWAICYVSGETTASKIVGYDLDSPSGNAAIIAESAPLTNITGAYDIEYVDGHFYIVRSGSVYIYRWNGSTIDLINTIVGEAGSITAQAITYDGSWLWVTQNGQNIYKLGLDGYQDAVITSGFPPNVCGWAWNGSNIVTFDYGSRNIYIINTTRLRIDTQKLALMGGNVGIGTISPNNKLVVVAGGDVSGINLSYDNTSNNRTGLFAWTRGSSLASLGGGVEYTAASTFTARSTAASYVEFGSGETRFYGNASLTSGNGFTPTERVRISTIGNVGIGTTAPYTNLDVQGLTDASLGAMGLQSQLSVSDSRNQIAGVGGGISFTGKYITSNATQTVFGLIRGAKANSTTANVVGDLELYAFGGSFKFHSQYNQVIGSNAVLMTLTAVGNLGIGTATPNAKLNILSTSSLSSVFKTEGVNGTLFEVTDDLSNSLMSVNTIGGLPVFEVFANNSIIAGQYGQNDFVISGNKVGIGTASPIYKLDVYGSSSSDVGRFYNNSASCNFYIGSTNNTAATALVFYTSNGNGQIFKNRSSTGWGGADSFNIYSSNGAIAFHPAGTTNALYIANNGNVGIGAATPAYKLDVNGTGRFSGDLTVLNLIGSYSNTSVYSSSNAEFTTPSRGIRAQSSSIQFTDSYAIAPYYTYRSTGDWPVPYGIGWGTGGESSGIFQRYASNGSSFGDMIFYTGNDGSGAFSFRRHTWEGNASLAATSGHLNVELFRVDWAGNASLLGTLTANVTGNLAGTATTATTANALNTGNSYTVTNLTATNEIGTRSTNIGANLERGDATVTTLRFDSDNFRFYGGGTGGIGEVLRITEGGSVGIGTTSTLQKLHVLGNTVFGNFGRNTYKYNLYLSFEAAADESWIRIYLPQDYSSTNNGGTVKVRVLWAGDHATFGAHEEYQISYKTYYPSPYLAFSNIICTNKTTDFAGATYYPASSTPNSIFYSNGSSYLYIKIKGYYGTINTTRFIEAEVFGRVAAVPTIETTTAPASPTELLKTIQFLPQEGNVIITGSLTGSLIGNVTGNVTGNVSGSSGTCNGLAASATTAATCTGNAAGLSATLAVASGGTGGNTQALGRAGLGATTLGANLFTLANVAAISFPRINADNTVSSLDAAAFRTAIGAGTGGGSGTVTGVTASAPLASSGGAAPDISLSGAVALANGGSGQTSAQAAMNAFAGAVTNTQYLRGNGTNVVMSAIQVIDVPILNQNTTGSSASCSGTAATANALNTANNYTVAQMTVSTSATPSSYVIHTGTSPSAIRLLAYTDSTYIQSGTSTSSSSADLVFSSMQAGAEWMRIKGATGRLGIGTSTPAYLLDVNGTIHYTALQASSDGRFKKNVQVISNPLDKLSSIRGVRFEWNEFINDRRNGYELNKPTFGVIAQELEEVFPELITLWKLSDDCTDARSVNYEKIIPILIEAVKELNNKNKLLESRLLILENK